MIFSALEEDMEVFFVVVVIIITILSLLRCLRLLVTAMSCSLSVIIVGMLILAAVTTCKAPFGVAVEAAAVTSGTTEVLGVLVVLPLIIIIFILLF
jgi:hypothetical protein